MTGKANQHRGEVTLKLSGATYKLVPSYENLAAMEEEAGISILEFAQRIHNRTIRISDLAAAVSTASEPAIAKEVAAKALLEAGLVKTIGPISRFFANALIGGQAGNAPPAKKK